eukprot:19226-Pelagococcus_subviridis.AAC.6
MTSFTTSTPEVLLYTSTPNRSLSAASSPLSSSSSSRSGSISAPVRIKFRRNSLPPPPPPPPPRTNDPTFRRLENSAWKNDTPSIPAMKMSLTTATNCSPVCSRSSAGTPSVSWTTTHLSPKTRRHLLMKKYACTRSSSMYSTLNVSGCGVGVDDAVD